MNSLEKLISDMEHFLRVAPKFEYTSENSILVNLEKIKALVEIVKLQKRALASTPDLACECCGGKYSLEENLEKTLREVEEILNEKTKL